MREKPQLLILDVNEILLDMSKVKASMNERLGSDTAFLLWFSRLLEFSLVETLTGNYLDFGAVGKAVLKITAANFPVELPDGEVEDILSTTQLPAHSEVPEALDKLKAAGFRMVPLTNGGTDTLARQLEFAGINKYFGTTYSVESVKKFKPHPDPYHFVLAQEKVAAEETLLIAAHAWDILGAHRAGLKTVLLQALKSTCIQGETSST